MESFGWEIRPAGWILLLIIGALVIYFLWKRSEQNSLTE